MQKTYIYIVSLEVMFLSTVSKETIEYRTSKPFKLTEFRKEFLREFDKQDTNTNLYITYLFKVNE